MVGSEIIVCRDHKGLSEIAAQYAYRIFSNNTLCVTHNALGNNKHIFFL